MNDAAYPPHLNPGDRVVLFDGVCKLCNAWSVFLIKHDKNRLFKLASVQSKEGQDILAWFGLPTDTFETMLYVRGAKAYQKSDAFLEIVSGLPFPWRLMRTFKWLPRPVRDWAYDRIALNRYWLFGKYDQCVLATPDHEQRFLRRDA